MNETIIAYRTSVDKLAIGCKVPASRHFYDSLEEPENQNKKYIENIFECNRPTNKPTRHNTTFVFKNKEDAVNDACNKNKYLYKVEIKLESPSHEGDWMWPIKAREKNGDTDAITECANSYWASKHTEKPIIEYLIQNATVVEEIIILGEERMAVWAKFHGQQSPEQVAEELQSFKPRRFESD